MATPVGYSSAPASRAFVTPQLRALRLEWPLTTAALESTYFTRPDWARTRQGCYNDAGYLLWGLGRYAAKAATLHAAKDYSREELDQAAANEVRYHATHNRQFNRAAGAFSVIWSNMVSDRPELLERARRDMAGYSSPRRRVCDEAAPIGRLV